MMTNNHGCDHECNNDQMHEICVDHIPLTFQDGYDEYVANVFNLLQDEKVELDEKTEATLKLGKHLLEIYRHSLQELELYREKYTPVPPLEMEMSALKNCHIGKCKCGQLLIENRDRCCPKCKQFIDWSCKDC